MWTISRTLTNDAPESGMSLVDHLDQLLLDAGVISETLPAITDFTPYENRRPIEVKGKPISETIVEERR
jgi:hypothetical protein